MSRKLLIVLLVTFTLLAVWGTLAVQGSPQDESAPAETAANSAADTAGTADTAAVAVMLPADGEISRTVDSPAISFIDSPSPTCYRPAAGTGICYITWNSLYVTASSGQYIISATVSIDNDLRAYFAGFFQNSMYIPGNLTGPGFKMTCGMPGSGYYPSLGKSYSYVIRARETGGLSAANSGSVTCPADVITVYLPLTRKR
jgi:hypothetical protein